MTGTIQPQEGSFNKQEGAAILTLPANSAFPLKAGDEVAIDPDTFIVYKRASDEKVFGVVEHSMKTGESSVAVRTGFTRLGNVSLEGVTPLPKMGVGIVPGSDTYNSKGNRQYAALTTGDEYIAIVIDNTDPTNVLVGFLPQPRVAP